MNFFGSNDTVDGKARSILGDLPEDPAPYKILNTVDQKAGEDVDPDDVVSRMRELDDDVDRKLVPIEGDHVDHKDMREAAGAIAERTDMSQAGAMQMLSSVVDSIEAMDPSEFTQNFGDVVDEYYRGDVDQNAFTETTTSPDMSDPDPSDSGTDPDPDADAGDDPGVDQKQGDEQMNPIDLVEEIGGSDARDTVENYAESVNKDPQDAAAEWVAENVPGVTVEGYGNDGGDTQPDAAAQAPAGADAAAGDQQGAHDRGGDYDQKLEDLNLDERIADAVTSDEVLGEMAGAVAQKMATDDDIADQLVETVDQKGDFATTDDTIATAPSTDSQTVSDAGAITGNGRGDDE